MNNVISQFENHVGLNPNLIAVVLNDKIWTYYDLNNYANFIAHMLLSKGITESTVVAVSGTRSFEMIAAIIAILKLKCAYMPIDLSLSKSSIDTMLENANIKYILSNGTYPYKSQDISTLDLKYEDFCNNTIYENLNKNINLDHPAYIMQTSGSTSLPKGTVIPHRGLLRLVVDTNYIDIKSSDSVLFHSNTSFDAAIFEIWGALLNGAQCVISPYMTGDLLAVFRLCQEREVSILLLTTGLFHTFSDLDLGKLTSLRYLVVGGDVMHSSCALRAIKKSRGFKIINGYGPAENTVFTTCLVIEKEQDITNPISIGKPIKGTKVYLLDEKLKEVKKGKVGEIYISGDGVALGYINAPKLTEERFLRIRHISENEILYRSGDMAKMLPSGNLEFIGRCDNQVKIRGFRVELTEIENMISSFDCIEDVCVCVVDGTTKKIAAYIKIVSSYRDDIENLKAKIISFLKQKLPSYCIPSYIQISKELLPLTRNGKINRLLLRDGSAI